MPTHHLHSGSRYTQSLSTYHLLHPFTHQLHPLTDYIHSLATCYAHSLVTCINSLVTPIDSLITHMHRFTYQYPLNYQLCSCTGYAHSLTHYTHSLIHYTHSQYIFTHRLHTLNYQVRSLIGYTHSLTGYSPSVIVSHLLFVPLSPCLIFNLSCPYLVPPLFSLAYPQLTFPCPTITLPHLHPIFTLSCSHPGLPLPYPIPN